MSSSGTTVLGFSFTGSTIPPYNPDCNEDFDNDGICDDIDECVGVYDECGLCNGEGIVDGTCDCNGNFLDECGLCGGDGIEDGACDCDGNINLGCGCGEEAPSGCDEVCGSVLEFDECGECGGDNSLCTGCTDETALNYEEDAIVSCDDCCD